MGRYELAAIFSGRALELVDGSDDRNTVAAMHASALERAGRTDEAEMCVREVLSGSPGDARAVRLLAHLERNSKRLNEASDRLEHCLAHHSTIDDWRLLYELGSIRDSQGNFPAAMAAMLSAKELLRPQADRHVRMWRARSTRQWLCTELLDQKRINEWGIGNSGFDLVLMAGFPRSGTTLLESILTAHPSCVGTDETGILTAQFTDRLVFAAGRAKSAIRELDSFADEDLAAGRAEYLRCTEAVIGEPVAGRILLEKEPLMTADFHVPLRLFPDCKILMPLRDPRDVVISFFFILVPLAPNSIAALTLEYACQYYAEVMRHWLYLRELLPQERWMESRYEDLIENPEKQTRKLAEFIGIEWTPALIEHHLQKARKAVSTPSYADVTQPLYTRSRERWRNYLAELEPHLHRLEPYIQAFGYR